MFPELMQMVNHPIRMLLVYTRESMGPILGIGILWTLEEADADCSNSNSNHLNHHTKFRMCRGNGGTGPGVLGWEP